MRVKGQSILLFGMTVLKLFGHWSVQVLACSCCQQLPCCEKYKTFLQREKIFICPRGDWPSRCFGSKNISVQWLVFGWVFVRLLSTESLLRLSGEISAATIRSLIDQLLFNSTTINFIQSSRNRNPYPNGLWQSFIEYEPLPIFTMISIRVPSIIFYHNNCQNMCHKVSKKAQKSGSNRCLGNAQKNTYFLSWGSPYTLLWIHLDFDKCGIKSNQPALITCQLLELQTKSFPGNSFWGWFIVKSTTSNRADGTGQKSDYN